MVWKVEKWLTDVFPGKEKIYSEYQSLSPRELAIVSAAVLDIALAELISLRLNDLSSECEDFLGLDGDGRAPVASFGARIQLALLVGLITSDDAAVLRAVKKLRNQFAHRVRVHFLSPAVLKATKNLHGAWLARMTRLSHVRTSDIELAGYRKLGRYLDSVPDAGAGLLLAVLTVYQAYFHQIHGTVIRVGEGVDVSSGKTIGGRGVH